MRPAGAASGQRMATLAATDFSKATATTRVQLKTTATPTQDHVHVGNCITLAGIFTVRAMLLQRFRPMPRWRSLLLLLALLCLVVKPIIGFAGELHRDLHAAHETAGAAGASDAADHNQPEEGLHQLLHVDLCCGNAVVMTEPAMLLLHLPSLPPAIATAWLAIPPRLASALRPPISI